MVSTREPITNFDQFLSIVSSPREGQRFNIEMLWFCEDIVINVPVLDILVDINIGGCLILIE